MATVASQDLSVARTIDRTIDAGAEPLLVEAAIAGDRQAFARLYDLHVSRVYRYAYYWLGSRSDTEDLTQQVFLQAWQSISRFRRGEALFASWLVTIAHNLIISNHRRASGQDTLPLKFDLADRRREFDPEAESIAAYDRVAVRRALLRLKADWQQVVILRYLDDLSYPEIAAALGKTEGNVRVILHRALVELRRTLDQEVKP
jgi:RNA polymerase sigma-70 factor, ECF subfamily